MDMTLSYILLQYTYAVSFVEHFKFLSDKIILNQGVMY